MRDAFPATSCSPFQPSVCSDGEEGGSPADYRREHPTRGIVAGMASSGPRPALPSRAPHEDTMSGSSPCAHAVRSPTPHQNQLKRAYERPTPSPGRTIQIPLVESDANQQSDTKRLRQSSGELFHHEYNKRDGKKKQRRDKWHQTPYIVPRFPPVSERPRGRPDTHSSSRELPFHSPLFITVQEFKKPRKGSTCEKSERYPDKRQLRATTPSLSLAAQGDGTKDRFQTEYDSRRTISFTDRLRFLLLRSLTRKDDNNNLLLASQ
eukprot:gene12128-8349_t